MKRFFKKHVDFSLLLFFTALATFVLFFVSADSYFNDLHSRVDSAWFFMCGKAWMNGLVPYVDFSDSKGPLLWLIYGIGYLLSPTNYHGVFWISCFWYGLIYFFIYKIARLFLPDTSRAILCSILMSIVLFNPWFHDEIRAEDFSLLFMIISLYEMSRLVWTDLPTKNRSFFILGICFAALLMIKYNIAAMQAIIVLACLIVFVKKEKCIFLPLLLCFGGCLSVLSPFIIYFLSKGILTPFIQEYFLNTFSTLAGHYFDNSPNLLLRTQQQFSGNLLITYLFEWAGVIYEAHIGARCALILLGAYLFSQKQVVYRFLPLLVSFWGIAITIRHHFSYYFTACSPFFIFLFICLLSLPKYVSKRTLFALSISVVCYSIISHILFFNYKCIKFNHNKNQQDFYAIASCIHQVKAPTIAYAGGGECGFGITENVLPAGKYWSLQWGANEKMKLEHKELILSGKADFIVVRFESFLEPLGLSKQDIENAGYTLACLFGENDSSMFYAKSDLGLFLND